MKRDYESVERRRSQILKMIREKDSMKVEEFTRLRLPWDSPGKNTGVGCHFLLQCMKVKSEGEVA